MEEQNIVPSSPGPVSTEENTEKSQYLTQTTLRVTRCYEKLEKEHNTQCRQRKVARIVSHMRT